MRSRKMILALLGVSLVTTMVIGYAVAQDRTPSGPRRDPRMVGSSGRRVPGMRGGEPQVVQKLTMMLHLIERMRDASFDPEVAGLIAIGGLKDDVRRGPQVIVKDLETVLAKTKTLGLRNAIRGQLKELYKQLGEDEKVLANLRAMLAENDKALQEEDDDDDDDDDEDDDDK